MGAHGICEGWTTKWISGMYEDGKFWGQVMENELWEMGLGNEEMV